MTVAPPAPTTDSIAGPRVRWRVHVAIAAVLYLAVALYALRPVLTQMRTSLPYPTAIAALGGNWLNLTWNDELLTASVLAHNARRIVTAPWRIAESWQCYPMENARALGEHMLGMGLRGAVPYALTRDPVATTNLVLIALPWLAAMAMYALVAYWTRMPAAALIAGLLFGFQPQRLTNLIHPYVEANDWTVVALLATHLTFTRGRWLDAALLAAAIVLQTLESFYPVLAFALIGGTYGIYLAARCWRRLPVVLPKLVAVAAVAIGVAVLIFAPYLHVRQVWGTAVGGRATILFQPAQFERGGQAYAGSVAIVLVAIALVDRARRRRDERGYDPRLPLVVAGLLTMWFSMSTVALPFGLRLPSLYDLAAPVVPGLDSIRGGGAIGRAGVPLVATFLAGYGVLALLERRAAATRVIMTAVIVAAALVDVFAPKQAMRDFGTQVTMGANYVMPKPDLLALYDRLPDGPVLDVPFDYSEAGILSYMPHYVFLAAYHQRPIGGCYNSFVVRVQEDIAMLVSRLPDRSATDALAALGFRSLMVHDELIMGRLGRLEPLTGYPATLHPPDPERTHLTLLDRGASHTAYVLDHPVTATTADAALGVGDAPAIGAPGGGPTVRAPQADVFFLFRNGAAEVYRHPPPIEPTWLRLRWYSAGDLVREDRVRDMLPLALAPGQALVRKITVPIAVAPGAYDVTLTRDSAPDVVFTRQRVTVAPAAARGGKEAAAPS